MLADIVRTVPGAAMAASEGKPIALRSILDPMLQDGSLRLSARHELQVEDPSHLVAGMKWILGTRTSRFNRHHQFFGIQRALQGVGRGRQRQRVFADGGG